jgi:hypothetical protein
LLFTHCHIACGDGAPPSRAYFGARNSEACASAIGETETKTSDQADNLKRRLDKTPNIVSQAAGSIHSEPNPICRNVERKDEH